RRARLGAPATAAARAGGGRGGYDRAWGLGVIFVPGGWVLPPPRRRGRARVGPCSKAHACAHPLPTPPPQAGEGADRVSALVLGESSAILGQKPHSSLPKSRLVMAQTAHRFAAGNLLRQRRASALDCVFVRRINRLSQNNAAPGTEKATPAWTLPPIDPPTKTLPTRRPPMRRATRCPPTCRAARR